MRRLLQNFETMAVGKMKRRSAGSGPNANKLVAIKIVLMHWRLSHPLRVLYGSELLGFHSQPWPKLKKCLATFVRMYSDAHRHPHINTFIQRRKKTGDRREDEQKDQRTEVFAKQEQTTICSVRELALWQQSVFTNNAATTKETLSQP